MVNIIPSFEPEPYQAWKQGTEELTAKAPVTRDQAIEVFTKLRKEVYDAINKRKKGL